MTALSFHGFYLTLENVTGEPTCPGEVEIIVPKNTVIGLTYFDESGMEFKDANGTNFRLPKPCPIIAAVTCNYCGQVIRYDLLTNHLDTNDNCKRVREHYL